ncbi:MAG: cysteine desulfurase-like protein [Gammaproteobacteria bacterium]|nr:cysteine desulfurase-like protein [Gammaproteobacteria bacterium]MDH3429425.1 cysteine desulfurase-like protein [Gammaproteobacteria bacterium]
MAIDLAAIRRQFPALSETDNGEPRLYFDNPAGTQVPKSVADRVSDCLLHKSANIGGYFRTSQLAGEVADGARAAMADFFNAPSPDEIIFGQNMTSITFHLSRSIGRHLRAGDEIVLSQMDHDANIEPWKLLARDFGLEIRWLPFDTESFEFDLSKLDDILSSRTRLVCVGGASNLTGTINDVETICAKTREAGAWSFIDAVQSAPHIVTDVEEIGCDFFVCSAYKFFGPHQGILWGRKDVLEQLDAYKVRPAPRELPWCFEAGTQSHEGMAGTAAAVDYFAWVGSTMTDTAASAGRRQQICSGLDLLFDYESLLAERLVSGLKSIPGVRIQGISDAAAMHRRVPTVSFVHDRHHSASIAEALARRNIFAWSGHNYALEAARALGIDDSGGAVRIGAVHYNSADEIDGVLNALTDILK